MHVAADGAVHDDEHVAQRRQVLLDEQRDALLTEGARVDARRVQRPDEQHVGAVADAVVLDAVELLALQFEEVAQALRDAVRVLELRAGNAITIMFCRLLVIHPNEMLLQTMINDQGAQIGVLRCQPLKPPGRQYRGPNAKF